MISTQQKLPVSLPGFPVIGNLPQFARDPIKFITQLHQRYGDVAAFSLMGNKSVLISNPADIERVLLETGKRFSKFRPTYAMRMILGNGLVTSEGDFWKRQRKLAAPAFHHQSIKRYADQMVAYAQDMAKTWRDGDVRNVHQDMMTLTQRIIMKVLFDVDVLENAGKASEAFDAMMQAIGAEMKGLDAILPPFIPTQSRSHMLEGVNYINGLLMEIIEKRRAEGSTKHDLLTMLMDARDDEGQPMSTEQLLDEIRSLYLAGHETTATTLSWTWFLLSRNPDVYAKLEAEIEQVLNGRAPTAEDVQRLSYCNAVIKESLRCYPVAWITQRIALEDVELSGYHIPKDTFIFLSPWIVHHDPRWYASPDTFMPERWLKDKSELPPREVYIPFGGGPHICLGNGLAMMEGVLLLATLLQHYHVSVLPDQAGERELAGTLRPKGGLQATFTARSR
jgi:cytochrome P450